ncbi:MotA/TolQ/ExbB proton channel family protein [Caballeronia sordidicola]|uniref:MotA/TolQ/ExbB proton channel family protein n=1 Tax=Caballeronia sordidicola TaxID=196367 RepID=A0A226X5E7_CABSO|nr:MotA/TolQ/ExbB proton channel family protein [Caballeronia sordidicola]OXC78048.1 MotA/TolQ/ExbB proton channel family protein [Caballeronia sordidicola]
MQDWSAFIAAMRVGGWVVYPLTVLAVLAIAIILDRAYVFARFSSYSEQNLVTVPRGNAFRRVAEAITGNGATPIWLREAKAQAAAVHIERDMGRGLWVLETIVTAAPLLGLLGTIVGMMHSFQLFGGQGLVNPGGVTGGVAQSLVATAIGLVVALIALFAFNYFSRRLERMMDDLEAFATEKLAEIRLDQETLEAAT